VIPRDVVAAIKLFTGYLQKDGSKILVWAIRITTWAYPVAAAFSSRWDSISHECRRGCMSLSTCRRCKTAQLLPPTVKLQRDAPLIAGRTTVKILSGVQSRAG